MKIRALLLLTLAGCAGAATGPAPEVYSGYYQQGFEVEAFRPCGAEPAWWVTEAEELRRRYRALDPQPYQEVFVVLRGTAGPEGRYGHLGAYPREVAVQEVLEIRAARQGDCT